MVAGAVMEAEHRRHSDGKAHEKGHHQELGVHDDGDGNHAVGADPGHEDQVEDDGDDAGRQIGDHLRSAVGTAFEQDSEVPAGTCKAQVGAVPGEEPDPAQCRDTVANGSCQGGSGDAHAQRDDKDIVQHHIGKTGAHCEPQAKSGSPRSDQEALEQALEHGHGHEAEQYGDILPGVVPGVGTGAQEGEHLIGEGQADHASQNAEGYSGQHHGGEMSAGLLMFPPAHFRGEHGTAAGGKHNTHRQEEADERIDDVGSGQGRCSHIPGDKEPVHNGIHG